MLIGYARVSTADQTPALQQDALTQAGLLAARARGRLGGRPKALNPRDVHVAQALYHDKNNSIAAICRTLRISRATLYRYMKTGAGKST